MNAIIKTALSTVLATGALLGMSIPKAKADVWFEPHRDRYARGTQITVAANDYWSFLPVYFAESDDATPFHWISSSCTDGWGVARISITVPTSVFRDNCYLYAYDYFGYRLGYKRIPIGR